MEAKEIQWTESPGLFTAYFDGSAVPVAQIRITSGWEADHELQAFIEQVHILGSEESWTTECTGADIDNRVEALKAEIEGKITKSILGAFFRPIAKDLPLPANLNGMQPVFIAKTA